MLHFFIHYCCDSKKKKKKKIFIFIFTKTGPWKLTHYYGKVITPQLLKNMPLQLLGLYGNLIVILLIYFCVGGWE